MRRLCAGIALGCWLALGPAVAGASGPWVVVPSANVAASSNRLESVSCVSRTSCVALGTADRAAIAEAWDGSSWKVTAAPVLTNAPYASLRAVDCRGSSCMAVGGDRDRDGVDHTLAARWDGRSWSVTPTPDGALGAGSGLESVDCPLMTSCFAVGSRLDPVTKLPHALIERWNGSTWSVLPAPEPLLSNESALFGISCASSSRCMAVGYSTVGLFASIHSTLVEAWDGSKWSVVSSPSRRNSSLLRASWSLDHQALYSVSCPTTSFCLAVGTWWDDPGERDVALVESWDGAGWQMISSPWGGGDLFELDRASCVSATSCMALGCVIPRGGASPCSPFTLDWNGSSLSRTFIPNVDNDLLRGLSCAADGYCVIVGSAWTGTWRTLALASG